MMHLEIFSSFLFYVSIDGGREIEPPSVTITSTVTSRVKMHFVLFLPIVRLS